jgi:hypothetical protein
MLGPGAFAQVKKSAGVVDANVATEAELTSMPNLTPGDRKDEGPPG